MLSVKDSGQRCTKLKLSCYLILATYKEKVESKFS